MQEKGLFLDRIKIVLGERVLVSTTQHVQPGEVLTVMGPSGAGKSALLAFLGGFLGSAFTARGRALVDGVEVTALPPEKRHAGLLFQDPLLFPHMSVTGNIMFALPETIKGRRERRRHAEEALEGVGLTGMGERDPETLSGGQKARVALARVLVSAPRMLLLDEPFSKLDTGLRQQMRRLVFEKARESGLPVLLVTHDEADAQAAGGEIVRIGE
ncbi:ATP-binding cassette domain-containing protein [Chelativorans sp. YIM 93263]|uniref:ATP-binding cassette domain-containing protein n=1 Tax=Chelativorans sp. YIM 93263 TaxID=2906648 RepID=UPI002378B962|nr:ATP-binding cassette domain-containing protein [Chelativorans sp. YIM 93263]